MESWRLWWIWRISLCHWQGLLCHWFGSPPTKMEISRFDICWVNFNIDSHIALLKNCSPIHQIFCHLLQSHYHGCSFLWRKSKIWTSYLYFYLQQLAHHHTLSKATIRHLQLANAVASTTQCTQTIIPLFFKPIKSENNKILKQVNITFQLVL